VHRLRSVAAVALGIAGGSAINSPAAAASYSCTWDAGPDPGVFGPGTISPSTTIYCDPAPGQTTVSYQMLRCNGTESNPCVVRFRDTLIGGGGEFTYESGGSVATVSTNSGNCSGANECSKASDVAYADGSTMYWVNATWSLRDQQGGSVVRTISYTSGVTGGTNNYVTYKY
jgi:hypothetical protein